MRAEIALGRRVALTVIAGALAALLACMTVAVDAAHAKSYSVPSVDINAELSPDGALSVTERRVFDLHGDFTCVWWEFGSFGDNTEFSVVSVELTDGYGADRVLPSVDFDPAWRKSGSPGQTCYAVDSRRNGVYVFSAWQDEQIVVTLSYQVTGMVSRATDIAEFYWKAVGDQWTVISRNVTLSLKLPKPDAVDQVEDGDVHVWGHQALRGRVQLDSSATVSAFTTVQSGQYAEIRAAFPANWLSSDAVLGAQYDHDRLAQVQSEEERFERNATSSQQREYEPWTDQQRGLVALVALCAVLIMIVGVAHPALRSLREKRIMREIDSPTSDLSDLGVHPLVYKWVERRGKRMTTDTFSYQLARLISIGAVKVRGERAVSSLWLVRSSAGVDDPIDVQAMKLLERLSTNSHISLPFSSDSYDRRVRDLFNSWANEVAGQGKLGQFVKTRALVAPAAMIVLALIADAALFVLGRMRASSDGYLTLIAVALAAALVFIIKLLVKKGVAHELTEKGCALLVKGQALRKAMLDMTPEDFSLNTDDRGLAQLVSFATALGIGGAIAVKLKSVEDSLNPEGRAKQALRAYSVNATEQIAVDIVSDAIGGALKSAMTRPHSSFGGDYDFSGSGGGGGDGGGGGGGGGGGAR